MSRLLVISFLIGFNSARALRLDEQPAQAPGKGGIKRAVGAGLGTGGIAGAAAGYLIPRGAQRPQPEIKGSVNGALAGAVVGLIPTAMSLGKGATAATGSLVTATGAGAGMGAGAAWVKKRVLRNQATNCVQIETQTDFNLTQYISRTWYPQYQNEQWYQKVDDMRCTHAKYTTRNKMYDLDVTNEAFLLDGSVNTARLCGKQDGGSTSAKLGVAPCWAPSTFGGPYWVLNYSESAGHAIVLGGQPNKHNSTTNKCSYQNGLYNGMWIFHRRRNPTAADNVTIENLKSYMENTLRIDTSGMIRTPQNNCSALSSITDTLADKHARFVELYNAGSLATLTSELYTTSHVIIPPTVDAFVPDATSFFGYMANVVGVGALTMSAQYTQTSADGNTVHEIGSVTSNHPAAQGPYYVEWRKDATGNFRIAVDIIAVGGTANVTNGSSGEAAALTAIQARNDQFAAFFNANNMTGVASLFANESYVVPPTVNAFVPRSGIASMYGGLYSSGIRNINLRAVHVYQVGNTIYEIGKITSSPGPVGPYYVKWVYEDGVWKLALDITAIGPAATARFPHYKKA